VSEISGAKIVITLSIAPIKNFLLAGSGSVFVVLLEVKTNGKIGGWGCI